MQKVILVEPVIAHYRKDVFNSLRSSNEFDFEIIAGRFYEGVLGIEWDEKSLFDHSSFKLFNHTFYYLKGSIISIYKRKPDAIICTGIDFHHIHTIFLFILFRIILRKKFFWWSHATFGNQGKIGVGFRKFFYRNSSGVFSYNVQGKDNLLAMGVKEDKILVVNNSLNREDYGFLNHNIFLPKESESLTILYSGRINIPKKVDLLIKAIGVIARRNSSFNFKCYIIGDGDLDGVKESY